MVLTVSNNSEHLTLISQFISRALLWLLLPLFAIAESKAAHKPLLIIAEYSALPYAWKDANGIPRGMTVDAIAQLIDLLQIDVRVEHRFSSTRRKQQQLATGNSDCGFARQTPLMDKYAVPISERFISPLEVWSLADSPIRSAEELTDAHLMALYPSEPLLSQYSINVHYVTTSANLIPALISKRVKGIVGITYSSIYNAKRIDMPLAHFHRYQLAETSSYLYCSKRSAFADQFPRWQEVGQQLLTSDKMRELFQKYLSTAGSTP